MPNPPHFQSVAIPMLLEKPGTFTSELFNEVMCVSVKQTEKDSFMAFTQLLLSSYESPV